MFRPIAIQPTLNGFIVTVGCQQLAYTDKEKLVRDLRDYINDPDSTERRIIESEGFNRKHTLNDQENVPRSRRGASEVAGYASQDTVAAAVGAASVGKTLG